METKIDAVEIKDEDVKEEDFSEDELNDEETDWKAKAQELKGIAKRRATQLGKAKAKLTEYTNKPVPKEEPKAPEKLDSQSNEPDYARLAYLETKGINHPDDQKIVQDEASRLKLSLTDVLAMEHIKSRLEASKDARTAAAGMPKGRGRTGGATQHDVEYWLAKGETPQGDQELAEKVIDARMSKERQNKFSDELYTG